MLGNWEREARMAELYERLSQAARDPTTRHQLERLAADERRHAKAWAGYLEGRGIAIPPRRPDAGAAALALLARVVGVGPVMSMAGVAEGQILRTYLGKRLAFNAVDLTNDELLCALRDRRPAGLDLDALAERLSWEDLVKFAKMEPLGAECSLAVEEARALVALLQPKLETTRTSPLPAAATPAVSA